MQLCMETLFPTLLNHQWIDHVMQGKQKQPASQQAVIT